MAQIDNVLFGRLLDVGRGCVAERDAERACAAFDEAINLWRGPALGGVDAPYAGVARATLAVLDGVSHPVAVPRFANLGMINPSNY
ncbi:BTAD domain-containing putative transcriptional regulator [Micromonospora sp. NPDC050795]|uniref:BTAD domain-containing putative transcriptional regulator n=1 Tax=Micromonospora sp. NPDC050795 TaxID=3364282 RepID=UPI00378E7003